MAASDAFYNGIITEVNAVIDEFGTSYTVQAEGTYDEDELEPTAGATRSVDGLVADQQTVLQLAGEAGATWVATRTLILKASSAPLPGEQILVDAKYFPLSNVVPIKPADIVVVYLLDISR